jgi:type II restriction enzyme
MQLCFYEKSLVKGYKSNSQIARRLTENWAKNNLYCPSCLQKRVTPYPNNYPVADFFCQKCSEQFQLKSQKTNFGKKVNDGEYHHMMASIINSTRPNFYFMKYQHDYCVEDLFVVPSFFFTDAVVEKRKPLSSKATRKGWVGCNLLLGNIPPEGKIVVVDDQKERKHSLVAKDWKKVSFMKKATLPERGWIIDVLNAVHSLEQKRFSLPDVYALESQLAKKHPKNYHIKDKIRQQLQFLRNRGILKFEGKGTYKLLQ